MDNLEKQEPTYERHDVQNTPFSIIKNAKTGECKIAIGNQLMSEIIFISQKAATLYINKKPWELMLNTMALMTINIINQQNTNNND